MKIKKIDIEELENNVESVKKVQKQLSTIYNMKASLKKNGEYDGIS